MIPAAQKYRQRRLGQVSVKIYLQALGGNLYRRLAKARGDSERELLSPEKQPGSRLDRQGMCLSHG